MDLILLLVAIATGHGPINLNAPPPRSQTPNLLAPVAIGPYPGPWPPAWLIPDPSKHRDRERRGGGSISRWPSFCR